MMQTKYIFMVIGLFIGALVVFNVLNANRVSSVTRDTVAKVPDKGVSSTAINDQPLGQQPKAMIDKANNQVDEINRLEAEKLAQINDAQ